MRILSVIMLIVIFQIQVLGQQTKEVKVYYDLGGTKLKEFYSVLVNQPTIKHGLYIKYDQRGLKALEIEFNKGNPDGIAKEFYLPQIGKAGDERLKTEVPYQNGIKNGISKTYVYLLNGQENIFKGQRFTALEEHFESDVKVREVKYYVDGSKEYDSYLVNGLTTKWYEDGKKKEEYTSSNGEINGTYKFWFENGQLGKEGQVVNGKEDGEWINYLEGGEVELKEIYELGFLSQETRYYESGSYSISKYEKGKDSYLFTVFKSNGTKNFQGNILKRLKADGSQIYDGPYQKWNENGSVIITGNFKNGQKDGEWITYDDNGTLISKEVFRNGYLIED